jgi:hypothetical protein
VIYEWQFFMFRCLQPMPCWSLHPVQTFWVNYRLKRWVQLLYTVTTYRECNEKRGLAACFGFRRTVSAAFSLVSGCTGSLHMILPCPCTWHYPIPADNITSPCRWYYSLPAHGIILSVHVIVPCPCAWYYPIPAHESTLSLHMILPYPCTWEYPVPAHDITLSLHMRVSCPCAWYYPVPAHDIALSLHKKLPYPCAWLCLVSVHGSSVSESTWYSSHDDPVFP